MHTLQLIKNRKVQEIIVLGANAGGFKREARRCGDPKHPQLLRAQEYTQLLRDRGEVRPTGRAKQIEDFLRKCSG